MGCKVLLLLLLLLLLEMLLLELLLLELELLLQLELLLLHLLLIQALLLLLLEEELLLLLLVQELGLLLLVQLGLVLDMGMVLGGLGELGCQVQGEALINVTLARQGLGPLHTQHAGCKGVAPPLPAAAPGAGESKLTLLPSPRPCSSSC